MFEFEKAVSIGRRKASSNLDFKSIVVTKIGDIYTVVYRDEEGNQKTIQGITAQEIFVFAEHKLEKTSPEWRTKWLGKKNDI